MKVYLAKFELNGSVAYKIGHTKFFNAIKRFDDDQYKVFHHVRVLCDINIQHSNATTARLVAKAVEVVLQSVYPKNFRLEEHFLVEDNVFNGLSGITEMFVLTEGQTEQQIIELFQRAGKRLYWVMEKDNV